jgi:hypothetical protein
VLISIPHTLALDLGDSADPVATGLRLLRVMEEHAVAPKDAALGAYLRLLPALGGSDYSTTTDFFSEQELEMLQWPPVEAETRGRQARYREMAAAEGVGEEALKWATWLVVSRVIAVSIPSVGLHKLLIPFLDFLNHDGDSPHELQVKRVASGLLLTVVAGAEIRPGDEVSFVYGGGTLGSDRFIQDYGFLDADHTRSLDRRLVEGQPERVREALKATSADEDRVLLSSDGGKKLTPSEALAIQFRLGLKVAAMEPPQREAL